MEQITKEQVVEYLRNYKSDLNADLTQSSLLNTLVNAKVLLWLEGSENRLELLDITHKLVVEAWKYVNDEKWNIFYHWGQPDAKVTVCDTPDVGTTMLKLAMDNGYACPWMP